MSKLETILFHSNASVKTTGYGNQTKVCGPALQAAGYKVVVSAFAGCEGQPQIMDGMLTLPRGPDGYGNDVIDAHFLYSGAQMVMSLIDVFALSATVWGKLPWLIWSVIDCSPIRPHEIDQFTAARWVAGMTRFGVDELRNAGREDALYIPHAIQTDIFKPIDHTAARRSLELLARHAIPDDAFLITTVSANGTGYPSRKNFDGMMRVFAMLAEQHPNALFYVHSESEGVWRGEPLSSMAIQYGIADKVLFPPSYTQVMGLISPGMLNEVYNASDLYMALSFGESFGIPTVEAQSAGCPVLVTDFAASAELCFSGWKVGGSMFQFYPLCRQMIPDIEQAHALLEHAYALWEDGKLAGMREKARAGALQYDVAMVMKDHFLPALEQISADLVREPQEQWLKRKHRPAPSAKFMRRLEKKKARRF